jgi:hypothetical protein
VHVGVVISRIYKDTGMWIALRFILPFVVCCGFVLKIIVTVCSSVFVKAVIYGHDLRVRLRYRLYAYVRNRFSAKTI